jgi:hypothetical protein
LEVRFNKDNLKVAQGCILVCSDVCNIPRYSSRSLEKEIPYYQRFLPAGSDPPYPPAILSQLSWVNLVYPLFFRLPVLHEEEKFWEVVDEGE